jgi:hypothetical protein
MPSSWPIDERCKQICLFSIFSSLMSFVCSAAAC